MTAVETIEKVKNGELKASSVLDAFLEKVKKEDGEIGAFLEIFEASAREKAEEIDRRVKAGERTGKLAGAVIAIKDNMLYKGHEITCASKILKGHISAYDSTAVKKLLKEDAVIIGRTNMDEFAMGSSTENSAYKKTRNPVNPAYVPGGSSGGSAAAVKAGFCHIALGSDTGGSIRQPAAFCGVYGLKPTYGAVSRYGLVAFASSLDQIGPLASTPGDLRLAYEAIKGHDKKDSTSLAEPAKTPQKKLGEMTAAIPENILNGAEEDQKESFEKLKEELSKKGVKFVSAELPLLKYALPAYYITASSEASSNLARFDGLRYGAYSEGGDLSDSYKKTRGEGFGPEVKRRIMLGAYSLSSGYYDAYYLKARKVIALIKEDLEKIFKKADFILTPSTPAAAFKFGEKNDPVSMYMSDFFTIPANLAGLCALSLPWGKRKSDDMPYGAHFIAGRFCEETLFRAAEELADGN